MLVEGGARHMLTVRSDQMAALANSTTRDFERRAIAHLRAFLPAGRDEDSLLNLVRDAIRRAAGYGIRNEVAVLRYLNAMVLLGDDFDSDPTIPWAGNLLRDRDFDNVTKMAILKDLIEQHLAG